MEHTDGMEERWINGGNESGSERRKIISVRLGKLHGHLLKRSFWPRHWCVGDYCQCCHVDSATELLTVAACAESVTMRIWRVNRKLTLFTDGNDMFCVFMRRRRIALTATR